MSSQTSDLIQLLTSVDQPTLKQIIQRNEEYAQAVHTAQQAERSIREERERNEEILRAIQNEQNEVMARIQIRERQADEAQRRLENLHKTLEEKIKFHEESRQNYENAKSDLVHKTQGLKGWDVNLKQKSDELYNREIKLNKVIDGLRSLLNDL